jgi:hypothetical protein
MASIALWCEAGRVGERSLDAEAEVVKMSVMALRRMTTFDCKRSCGQSYN